MLCLCIITTSAFAGGWDNSLIGARSAGLGTAFVGIANDATAIYYNSAGLAFSDNRGQFIICGKTYFPTHTYINASGKKSTSEINATLVELFSYYRLNERWILGLGIFTPYAGGGMKWNEKDVGYSVEGSIGTINFSPALVLKLFPDLSIGLNLNYYYIVSHQNINDPLGQYIFQRFELPIGSSEEYLTVQGFRYEADEKGAEYAMTASIFYRPNNKFSLGITYHGSSNVGISGTSNFNGKAQYQFSPAISIPIDFLGECKSSTKFYLPASYAMGISYRIRPKLLLAAEYDYYYWSKLKYVEKLNEKVPVFINGVPIEETGMLPEELNQVDWIYQEPLGFSDSYYLKLGAEYLYTDKLTIRVGTSYDNGKVARAAFSITNIDVTKLSLLAGLGYRLGAFDVNLAGFMQIGYEEAVPASPNNEKYDLDSMGVLASLVSTW